MEQKKLNLIFAAVLLVLTIIIGFIFFRGLVQDKPVRLQNDQAAKSSQTKSITEQNPSSNTSLQTNKQNGLKTYSNAEYSFSFKYPVDFSVNLLDSEFPSISIAPPASMQNEGGSYLEIDPVNVGSESVFDALANPSCVIKTINFAGRAAKECKESRTDVTYRNIQITDLNNLKWGKSNELGYEIRGRDPVLEKAYNDILATFKFSK